MLHQNQLGFFSLFVGLFVLSYVPRKLHSQCPGHTDRTGQNRTSSHKTGRERQSASPGWSQEERSQILYLVNDV